VAESGEERRLVARIRCRGRKGMEQMGRARASVREGESGQRQNLAEKVYSKV
jgi:hypothetical protein